MSGWSFDFINVKLLIFNTQVWNCYVLNLRNTVFWNVTSCSLVLIYRRYEGTPCLMNLRQDIALRSSGMSKYCYQNARRHIPADGGVHLPVHPCLSVRLFQVHARIASYLHAHATTQRDSRRARKELERNRRTTLLLTGIAVLFAVSWLPLGQ